MREVHGRVAGDSVERDSPAGHIGHIDVVPFEAWHLQNFSLREEQKIVAVDLTPDYAKALQHAGPCFSAWAGYEVIAVAGVVSFWPGRAQVWALMSDQINAYGWVIHRHVVRYLSGCFVRRLECVIDPRFQESAAWAIRLGFKKECTMPRYGVHGQDMDMYVRYG